MKDVGGNKGKNLNFKRLLRKNVSYALLFLMFLIPSGILSQVNTDSLKTDSAKQILRVKVNSKDTTSGFVPIDSLNYNDLLDTVARPKKNPKRASLYSAILPGLGQAYNGNYWKIPIIYSLFLGVYFIAEDNNFQYQKFRQAYLEYPNVTIPGINPNFKKENLKEIKDYYKRNRDLNIIIMAGVYLLNILDACVDAHLMDYDISEDLSLKIRPKTDFYSTCQNNSRNSGFGIKFVLSLH